MGAMVRKTVVHNDTEFYLAIARFSKPLLLQPLEKDQKWEYELNELECKALIHVPENQGQCQCCEGEFPPPYPFIVVEGKKSNEEVKANEVSY